MYQPKCHWKEEFVRGHSYARQLPNLDDGVLHEVRLINDSYPSAYLSMSIATGIYNLQVIKLKVTKGLGVVLQVWIGQDSNYPFPASSVLMWSLYSTSTSSWDEPATFQNTPCINVFIRHFHKRTLKLLDMDGVPFALSFATNSTTYAVLWVRSFGVANNVTSTDFLDPTAADTSELMISFYNDATQQWTSPHNITNNNQFDGAAVAAVFTPPRNPLPNLLIMWLHKPFGGSLFNISTTTDIMYTIYNYQGIWSPPTTVSCITLFVFRNLTYSIYFQHLTYPPHY